MNCKSGCTKQNQIYSWHVPGSGHISHLFVKNKNPLEHWSETLCVLLNQYGSQSGIPLKLSLLPPVLVCGGCVWCLQESLERQTNCCVLLSLWTALQRGICCVKPSWSLPQQLRLCSCSSLCLSAQFLHHTLSMLKQTLQFSSLFNYYLSMCVYVDEWMKERECMESSLSRNGLSCND